VFEQIMVPLDGSARAEHALPVAERLAAALGAILHLVRVVEPPTWVYPLPLHVLAYDDLIRAETQQAMAYLEARRTRLAVAGVRAYAVHLIGSPAAALLDYERTKGIGLVVTGSHGRSRLSHLGLDTVADSLLRHGGAPILLVPERDTPVTLERVVVPLDGSERAEQALPVVEDLAVRCVVHEATLLRAVSSPEQRAEAERYLAATAARRAQAHVIWRWRVEQGQPAQVIVDVAGTAALVVMAAHGRTGLLRQGLSEVAERVVHSGTATVLLVRVR
jgi:nucleotide-binding universal stress UspA family protein